MRIRMNTPVRGLEWRNNAIGCERIRPFAMWGCMPAVRIDQQWQLCLCCCWAFASPTTLTAYEHIIALVHIRDA